LLVGRTDGGRVLTLERLSKARGTDAADVVSERVREAEHSIA
jgi:hypothetical protein